MNEERELRREALKIALMCSWDTEESLNKKVDDAMARIEAHDRMVENEVDREWIEAHTDRTWRDYQG